MMLSTPPCPASSREATVAEYEKQFNERGGYRYDWQNPPAPGTKFLDSFGDVVVFEEIGIAGMLTCTRESDGLQSMYQPELLRLMAGETE